MRRCSEGVITAQLHGKDGGWCFQVQGAGVPGPDLLLRLVVVGASAHSLSAGGYVRGTITPLLPAAEVTAPLWPW